MEAASGSAPSRWKRAVVVVLAVFGAAALLFEAQASNRFGGLACRPSASPGGTHATLRAPGDAYGKHLLTASPGKLALSFNVDPDGGLTNQRIRVKGALMHGAVSGRTVHLPVLRTRQQFLFDWGRGGWHDLAFEELFDLPYLTACAAGHGVAVAPPCPPDGCAGARVKPTKHKLAEQNWPALAGESHVRLDRPPVVFLERHQVPMADAFDGCLRYAPAIREAAAAVVAAVRAKFGAEPSAVLGLHLRVEDDALGFFGRVKAGDAGGVARVADAALGRVLSCIEQHAGGAAADPGSVVVYVASGEPLTSPKLKRLVDRFPRVVTKETVAKDVVARLLPALGQDGIAGIDHLVLAQAGAFIGYGDSTFSTQVAQERLRVGKTSALHNAWTAKTAECPAFQQFVEY